MEENINNPSNINQSNINPDINTNANSQEPKPETNYADSFLNVSYSAPSDQPKTAENVQTPIEPVKKTLPQEPNSGAGCFILLGLALIIAVLVVFFFLKRKVSPPTDKIGQPISQTVTQPIGSEEETEEITFPNQTAVKAEIVDNCRVKIISSDKTVFVQTNIGYQGFSFNCQQLLVKVSPSGRYVVFQDLYTGNNAMLTLFSVEKTDNYVLDYFGQAQILDLKFIDNDIPIVLYQDDKGQYLKSYDLAGLMANYPANIGAYKMFTDLNELSKVIKLPDYSLAKTIRVLKGKVQVYTNDGAYAMMKEYRFDEVMPPLRLMKK